MSKAKRILPHPAEPVDAIISTIIFDSMPSLVIELPARPDQTAFNLKRWTELLDDAELARIEGRIETDRHGQVIMSPPPSANHARYGYKIARLIEQFLPGGESLTECPISTADGFKSADAVWASKESIRNLGNRVCFPRAPGICVEVLSPQNTKAEIEEKKSLYFNAGAKDSAVPIRGSKLCPQFPNKIVLAT